MYPTGKSVVVTGIAIDRIAGGKIVESWGNFDQLGLLQQIGLLATFANRPV
jgi:predicted ester cyclase